tara:strand:- start:1302 stop:1550 length:249 start_codon:yes stop_codon:yes gene_type:complete
MPLVKSVLEEALKNAFIAGEKAMNAAGSAAGESTIRKKGGEAFAAVAAPAIDAYIKSGLVTTAVVTAGSAVAQAGTGTGAIT